MKDTGETIAQKPSLPLVPFDSICLSLRNFF